MQMPGQQQMIWISRQPSLTGLDVPRDSVPSDKRPVDLMDNFLRISGSILSQEIGSHGMGKIAGSS